MSNELVIGCLERIKERITENIRTSGEWASGETAASMTVYPTERGGMLVGRDDFQSLEEGRPAGNVPRNFKAIIYDWMEAKGIPTESNEEKNSMAYLIARKIAEQGTQLYRQGGRKDIYTNVIDEEVVSLTKQITEDIKLEIVKSLL